MLLHSIANARYKWRLRQHTKHLSGNLLKRIFKFLLLLLALIAIHTIAMFVFEGMRVGDALWLSVTTVTTVGYGDFSPSSIEGRIVTVVTMYIMAIALMGQIVGEYMDWRSIKSEKLRSGTWEFRNMQQHIQILNTPNINTELYLDRLLTQIRCTPELMELPVQLLSRKYPDGIPAQLKEHKLIHRTGRSENTLNLQSVNVDKARYIIVLARDATDPISDSLSFDILSRIAEIGTDATLVVEAVNDENRARLYKAGADVIIRPIRAYPEIVVRSLTDPGTEQVMENIFNHQGGRLVRVDCQFSSAKWSDLQVNIIQHNLGTPIAFVDESGKIIIPDSNQNLCSGKAIISLVSDKQSATSDAYQALGTL